MHIALYLSLPLARNFAQAKELHGLAVVPQPLRDRRPRHIHGLWVVELVGGVEPRELYLFGVNSAAQAVNIAKHVPAVRGIGLHRHLSAALAPAQLGHLAEPPRGASASTPSPSSASRRFAASAAAVCFSTAFKRAAFCFPCLFVGGKRGARLSRRGSWLFNTGVGQHGSAGVGWTWQAQDACQACSDTQKDITRR